jgi:hypothetical protein
MADLINSVLANSDGSYVFNFTFDNGAGILGNTNIVLPAPQGTPAVYANDGVTVVTPAVAPVPYTDATAKAAVLSIASAQKATWMAALSAQSIVGTVNL